MRSWFLLIIGLLYCVAGALSTFVSVLLVTRKVNDNQLINVNRLPDIVLNYVPEYVFLFEFTEGSIIALIVINVVIIIMHQRRWVILKRTFVIFGTIYWLRFFTLIVTFFPIPNDRSKCPTEKYAVRGFLGILHDLKGIMLTFGLMNSGMVSCGDSMFSGHAASVVILASNFTHYIPKHFQPLRFVIWIWACLAILTILLSHMHYTMDVIIGVWVSRHIFTMYYQIVFVYEIFNAAGSNDEPISLNSVIINPNESSNPNNNNDENTHPTDTNLNNPSAPVDHTVFCIDSIPEYQITANFLLQNFGIFVWLNLIFVFFEKHAKYHKNILLMPQCVSYVTDKIKNVIVKLKLRFQNNNSCVNLTERMFPL